MNFASGTLYYVPVTITNSQSTATPATFQTMITVDSSTYSSYLASNLQNVNWQDGAGNILDSWLESGNSNSSTASVYWVKLTTAIPASSSTTIYLCFYSTSTNNFNTTTTGEAPTLSGTYGQYDNGANVFSNYWNFAGTSLPSGWSAVNATVSVSNGLNVTTNSGYNWIGAYTTATTPNLSVIDTYAKTTSTNFNYGLNIATNNVAFQDQAGGPPSEFIFGTGGSPTSPPTANGAAGGTGIAGTMLVLSAFVNSGAPILQANYSTQVTGSYSITTPTQIGLGSSATNSAFFQWARTRAYPPNATMPSSSFGSVTTVGATYARIASIALMNAASRYATATYNHLVTLVRTASVSMMNSASRFAAVTYDLAITWARTASVSMMNAASRYAAAAWGEITIWTRSASMNMMNAASRYAVATRALIIKISSVIRWDFWTFD